MMQQMPDPASLPAAAFTQQRKLPALSAVYFVLDAADNVLYVGQSRSLHQRWQQHHKSTRLAEAGAKRIAWLEVSDAALLPQIEVACIAYFEPPLNGPISREEREASDLPLYETLEGLNLPHTWLVQTNLLSPARFHRVRYHGWPLREEEVDAILEAIHAFARRLLAVTRADLVAPTARLIPRGRERRPRR